MKCNLNKDITGTMMLAASPEVKQGELLMLFTFTFSFSYKKIKVKNELEKQRCSGSTWVLADNQVGFYFSQTPSATLTGVLSLFNSHTE